MDIGSSHVVADHCKRIREYIVVCLSDSQSDNDPEHAGKIQAIQIQERTVHIVEDTLNYSNKGSVRPRSCKTRPTLGECELSKLQSEL